MKNKILFPLIILLFSGIFSPISAQLRWNVTEEGMNDSQVRAYLGESDQGYGFVFSFPTRKWFSELRHGIAIRYFDEDMNLLTQEGLSENTPPYLNIRDFNEYIAVFGKGETDHEEKGDAVILFLDEQGQEVERKTWSLSGSRHIWIGSRAYISSDSAHFIVCFREQCIPDQPSLEPDPIVNHVAVFDRDLKVVWERSYDNKICYSRKQSLAIDGLNFTRNNQLLIYGTEYYDNHLHIFAFTVKDAKSEAVNVLDETLPSLVGETLALQLNFRQFISPSNDLIVFAYITEELMTRSMFFVRQNLTTKSGRRAAYYLIDDSFEETYPFFGKGLRQFPLIRDVSLWNDGLIVSGERIIGGTSCTVRNISLLKFSSDGVIEWVKSINKNIYFPEYKSDYLLKVFPSGEELVLFYYDTPENVNSDVLVSGNKSIQVTKLFNGTCLTVARINSEGLIESTKIINRYIENQIIPDNSSIHQVDEKRFILYGTKNGNNAFSTYTLD